MIYLQKPLLFFWLAPGFDALREMSASHTKFLAIEQSRSAGLKEKDVDPFWQNLVPRFPKNMSYHGPKNLPYPYIYI